MRVNAHVAASNSTVVRPRARSAPAPGADGAPWDSSAVDALDSQPSMSQMPSTIADTIPPQASGAPVNATASGRECPADASAAAASTTTSAASRISASIAVGRSPYHSSSAVATIQPHAASATASAFVANSGRTRSRVYVPAGSAVARIANMLATSRIHAPYAPPYGRNAARIHAYDDPASRMRSPRRL